MSHREGGVLIRTATKPLAPRTSEWLKNAVILCVLGALLLVVSTPMLWMIVTAFKTKGTAFQLQFLPQTEIAQPKFDQPPALIPRAKSGAASLYFEQEAPSATTVAAMMEADGNTIEVPMHLTFDGMWTGLAGPLEPGEHQYAIVVNGGEAGEPASATTTGEGVSPASTSRAIVYTLGGIVHVALQHRAGRDLSILLDGKSFPLAENQTGVYTLQTASPAESFRVIEHVPLGEAIGNLYTLDNFKTIVANPEFQFTHYFMNSLIVATSAALLTVLICSLAAYAFVHFEFHFRDAIFLLLLSSMLVPGMIYMVPQFSITIQLGMMNTYAGMVVPHLANVFGLFLMKQYISQIPRDLFSAAEIDGASDAQVFRTVVIPICLPIMVTLFLFTFVTQWSNFLWQLIINTGDSNVLTLPVGLQQFKGQNANDWESIMAGACFSILPISILFFCLQRYFMQGLTAGSVKE